MDLNPIIGRLLLFTFLGVGLVGCTERRQEALLQKAEERISQTKYSDAVDLLKKSVALNPESRTAVRALYKSGFVLESFMKDYEGALFNYQEYIRLSKDPVSIYEVQKRIASLYFEQLQDSEKAIAAYKRLVAVNPDSLERDTFQLRIAQSLFRQNKFEAARAELQNLIEKFPKSQYVAKARFDIGNTYYMEGKCDIAIEALKQVLRFHPQSEFATEAQFVTAECFENQEKLATALQLYESLERRYSSPDIIQYRIQALRKRLKGAIKDMPR